MQLILAFTFLYARILSLAETNLVSIIFGYTWGHYDQLCSDKQIPTLHNRRTELSKSFFNQSVLDKNSCLHYLLPLPRTGFVDKLRSRLQYIPQTAKTARFQHSSLADGTNGRAIATLLRLSSVVCLSVMLCIVAKRCVLEQKLLLRAYRKSYMRNRLVPK